MECNACVISSHKPTRFKWKYNENNNGCKRLKRRVRDQLIRLYEQGVRRFYLDGSLGVDIWAGELLLELKEQPEYSDIELVLVLPFPRHDAEWDKVSRQRLSRLRQRSTEVVVAGTSENPPAVNFKLRDQYLINHTDCVLAVYDNNPEDRSAVNRVVTYARRKNMPITLLHPDSAVASYENQEG